jgi:hypothetical protein
MEIFANSTFGWLNYSSASLRVSFAAEVARKLTCKGPSKFKIRDDRLESEPIQAAEFTSLCHLARGEYEYIVEMSRRGGAAPTRLSGMIVVTSPFESEPLEDAARPELDL